MAAAESRIAALDLIRGAAVLGILIINIASFAAAPSAAFSPDLPGPGTPADHWSYLANLVLFEGKMRALFLILFGASLLLFVERAKAADRDGESLQLRRLGWLALFGYLHYLLLWHGDILLLYAVAGVIALFMRRGQAVVLLASGLFLLTIWQGWGAAMWHQALTTEAAVREGSASAAQVRQHRETIDYYRERDAEDLAVMHDTWTGTVRHKLIDDPGYPVRVVFFSLGETLSYVVIGMALLRSGFFAGSWPRRRMLGVALGGIGLGGLATGAFALWTSEAAYPEVAMRFAVAYGLTFAHLAMALGYAAALVLLAPRLHAMRLGQRLSAAGRMAFSNYIGTSLVMTALFYGWGLGLAGTNGPAALWGFVLLGWALMLAWSAPWLARFGQGPLERLWRRLAN